MPKRATNDDALAMAYGAIPSPPALAWHVQEIKNVNHRKRGAFGLVCCFFVRSLCAEVLWKESTFFYLLFAAADF